MQCLPIGCTLVLASHRAGVQHHAVVGLPGHDKGVVEVANERAGAMERQTDQRRLLSFEFQSPGVSTLAVKFVAVIDRSRKVVSRPKSVLPRDAKTGKEKLSLEGHIGWVRSVAFSPDGSSIVSGSADKTLKIWNLKGGNSR